MWFWNKRLKKVAAMVDGEATIQSLSGGLSPEERRHQENMNRLHAAAQIVVQTAPRIEDSQFDAFMQGIWQGVEESPPATERNMHWARLSLAAAALVIVGALMYLFMPASEPVRANQVESVSTELENSTVDWYDGKDGQTTIWVKPDGRDME